MMAVLAAMTLWTGSAAAQSPAKMAEPKGASSQPAAVAATPTAKTHPNDPMLWDAEKMMDDAVDQISARYKLTDQQKEYTRLFLRKRVREFLDQYETDVRELLQEQIDIRLGKKSGDKDAMSKWATRAAPIYEAAKNAIMDGNHEWGEILDASQKEIHNKDLGLMERNFASVTKTLKDYEEGRGPAIGPRGANLANGGVGPNPQTFTRTEIEDQWIAYVERFISAYKLDDAKKIAAREKIHKDQLEKAKQYREANKDKFRKIEDERKLITVEMTADERMKRIRELDKRKKELEIPIRAMFVDMCRRLDALPSSKQQSEVSEVNKKFLADLHKRLAGESTKQGGSVREMTDKPSGDAQPSESSEKPGTTSGPAAEPAKLAETPKPADTPKPAESGKPAEQPKDESKP